MASRRPETPDTARSPRGGLRAWCAAAALLLIVVGAAPYASDPPDVPVVFVHGNGDSAAVWTTTIWRFESNGYDASRLVAVDLAHPSAPRNDAVTEPNRSSTTDQAAQLAAAVTRTLLSTASSRVALVGSSRGGNTIRNYIRYGGGHAAVLAAVLCGTPNHGVLLSPADADSEWNGNGTFLARLNANGEVHPGVRWVTIRSDRADKYAQAPGGEQPGADGVVRRNSGFDSPSLSGADNVVLDGLDHREVAFHRRAFAVIYRAVTGRDPRTLDIVAEVEPLLDGVISGFEHGAPTNLPLAGASVEVYEVDPFSGDRRGPALHAKTTGADGRWGPFRGKPTAYYEFAVSAEGYPTTHVYRSPFPRSSRYVNVRLGPLPEPAPREGGLVVLTRPRGYFGHSRDSFTIDGTVPDGVPEGVPTLSTASRLYPPGPSRTVRVAFNEEAFAVRTYPLEDGHVVYAEFHY